MTGVLSPVVIEPSVTKDGSDACMERFLLAADQSRLPMLWVERLSGTPNSLLLDGDKSVCPSNGCDINRSSHSTNADLRCLNFSRRLYKKDSKIDAVL